MSYSPSWHDQESSWWVKANRAREHLNALRRQADEFRASEPYALTPEPTDTPDLTAYRLHIRRPFPTSVNATIGDILHNLRAALECLAYEVAKCCHGGSVPPEQERETTFPICATPEAFARFFAQGKRKGLYDERAQKAFRSVQPFHQLEAAHRRRSALDLSFEEAFQWSILHCLDVLWNIDKHRRLTLLAWWPDLIWWGSDGHTNRKLLPGDGTFEDGSILFYIHGHDEGRSNEVSHEFNITLTDDPAYGNRKGVHRDVVEVLSAFHTHIHHRVFSNIFRIMSEPAGR